MLNVEIQKIPVGISSCLIGERVRFDGGHQHNAYLTDTLGQYFDFQPFCPEMGIGLGTPRPTLHLANIAGEVRCVEVKRHEVDVTEALRDYAWSLTARHALLCGYIFKKSSPSCGMERVKIYENNLPTAKGIGIYAEQVLTQHPLLPVEEEGRLGDPKLRENFIQRVYVLYRWKQMLAEGLSIEKLGRFHAQHKLMIMSHGDYRPLGQLVAKANSDNLTQISEDYIAQLMTLLKKIATRGQHLNVLQHIQGYLKKQLTADNKAELAELMERYRIGEVPLIVPITLLKHHFRSAPDPYIEQSYYMQPYPETLSLTNQL